MTNKNIKNNDGIRVYNAKYDKNIFNNLDNIIIKFINVGDDFSNINPDDFFEKATINDNVLMQDISKIKIPDKKYFHKTVYADLYYKKFSIELKPNTLCFDLSYDILCSIIKFYRSLIHYKDNKIKRYEELINILKPCLNKYKKIYKESNDLHIIKLYNLMKKMYKLLKDMNKVGKYNFTILEKEIEFEIYLIKYSHILDINYIPKQSIIYSNKNTYSVF